MINKTELRVGSLVHHKTQGILVVIAVGRDGELALGWPNREGWLKDMSVSDITPISLVPEILEKCGFVKDGFNAYNITLSSYQDEMLDYYKTLCFQGDYLYIKELTISDKKRTEDIVTLWNKDEMKEFYLHRLQNLYLDLTGTELQIIL